MAGPCTLVNPAPSFAMQQQAELQQQGPCCSAGHTSSPEQPALELVKTCDTHPDRAVCDEPSRLHKTTFFKQLLSKLVAVGGGRICHMVHPAQRQVGALIQARVGQSPQ